MAVDRRTIERVALRDSGGVVTVADLLRDGATRSWVQRQVESGRWRRLHEGVLVVHGGPLLWVARAHAALLRVGAGSALSHDAAAWLHGFARRAPATFDVSVPHGRRVVGLPAGIVLHRTRRPVAVVEARGLRATDAATTVVDCVSRLTSADDVLGLLCAAVRVGVRAEAVLADLGTRRQVRHRGTILELLGDVRDGVESALEGRYYRDVERRHGLPSGTRQQREVIEGRWIRSDVRYARWCTRVELDGELAHPGGRTADDVWRDNAVVLSHGEVTLRYRWHHVRRDPCGTAAQVVRALRAGGWADAPTPCGRGCPVR
ncbi:MAG: hypothetical protein H5T83_10525 [Actinotalea sp.]|nr:hypothetical protein [Actinotalea sp.]